LGKLSLISSRAKPYHVSLQTFGHDVQIATTPGLSNAEITGKKQMALTLLEGGSEFRRDGAVLRLLIQL
jgi:hypothetical protein